MSITDKLCQDGQIATYILRINKDCINSPAEVNPKGTSVTAEGKKRTSASVAKAYGYCIFVCEYFNGLVCHWNLHIFLKKYLKKRYEFHSVCCSLNVMLSRFKMEIHLYHTFHMCLLLLKQICAHFLNG